MSTGHIMLIVGIVFLCVALIGGLVSGIVLSHLKKSITHQIQNEYH